MGKEGHTIYETHAGAGELLVYIVLSAWCSLRCLLLHHIVLLQPLGHSLGHLDILVNTVHGAVHLVCVCVRVHAYVRVRSNMAITQLENSALSMYHKGRGGG